MIRPATTLWLWRPPTRLLTHVRPARHPRSAQPFQAIGSRVKRSAKILRIIVCCCVAGAVAIALYFVGSARPPKEAKLIQIFQDHRAEFERLREMLQADTQVVRLASWGVETTDSVVPRIPPEGTFPVDRYMEYMNLLKQVGGHVAYRGKDQHPHLGISLWASGFAGNARHIGLSWRDQAPTNRIASLDAYRGTSKYGGRQVVYRHLDSNWYLWTDL